MRAEANGQPIWFRTRKTSSLLGYAACHLGKPIPRETLTSIFWPEAEDSFARNSLSVCLTSLRKQLEQGESPLNQVLVCDSRSISLAADTCWSDVDEFHRFLKKSRILEQEEQQLEALFAALDLYDGPLLAGDAEDWARLERHRLEQSFQHALCRVLDSVQDEAGIHRALNQAGKALTWDPKNGDLIKRVNNLRKKVGVSAEVSTRKPKAAEDRPLADAQTLKDIQHMLEHPLEEVAATAGENLGGAVPLSSPHYLPRPADGLFAESIEHRDSIVLIKGPRQIGKSSLLARGVAKARSQGAKILLTDFQSMDSECLQSTRTLYLWLISMFLDQTGRNERAESFWSDAVNPSMNLERFVKGELLGSGEPVFWGMDEVDRVFSCPYKSDFFGLLRSWHNRRAMEVDSAWSNLTVAVTYATEAHAFIEDLNQSPFNVGIALELNDFDLKQVAELNRMHGNPLKNIADLQELFSLIGGHPYLLRRGLNALSAGMSLADLISTATNDHGPFADHLRRLGALMDNSSEARAGLQGLLAGRRLSSHIEFYRLRSAGVVVGSSLADARIRCGLYQRYLTERAAILA